MLRKKYTETLNLLVSVNQKADLEARALQEEVSMALIVRRAIDKELSDSNLSEVSN